jgi:RNA polymerase sigma factor (sigma-70 family)
LDEHRQFVTQLFERHRKPLLHYLTGLLTRREDAEEVLQDAYLRILDSTALERSEGKARAFLFKVATNLAYDCFRRRRTRGPQTSIQDACLASDDPSPERMLDIGLAMEALGEALEELKPRCRRVFLLRAAEQLSYAEIAERLGVSKRTAEREMQAALIQCQEKLGKRR